MKISIPALSIKLYLSIVALRSRDLKLPVKPQWKLHIPPGIILKIGRFGMWGNFFLIRISEQRASVSLYSVKWEVFL